MYKVSNYGDYTITKVDSHEQSDKFTIFDTLEEAKENVLERAKNKRLWNLKELKVNGLSLTQE